MKIFEFRGLNVKNSQFRHCETCKRHFAVKKPPFLRKWSLLHLKPPPLRRGLGVGIAKGNAYHAVILSLLKKAKNPRFAKNA